MARKKNQNNSNQQQIQDVTAVAATETDDPADNGNGDEDQATDDEELELLQVDVGDMVKMKQILDETVAGTVLENIQEDYRSDNMKLIIMTTACAFAMFGQFAPVPFPDSRPILAVCCCMYFLLSGILQFITFFIDEDCILITQPSETSTNQTLQEYGIRVRSDLPRFSEFYSITLQFQKMPGTPYVTQQWSVGNFFDVDGMFDEVGLTQAVQAVYDRLEAGRYDSTDSAAASKAKKD